MRVVRKLSILHTLRYFEMLNGFSSSDHRTVTKCISHLYIKLLWLAIISLSFPLSLSIADIISTVNYL